MAEFPPPSTGPVGWYPDPQGSGLLRYFNGRQWEPVHPGAPQFEAEAEAETEAATERDTGPQIPLRAGVLAVVILVVSLLLSGIGLGITDTLGVPDALGIALALVIGYGPVVVWSALSAHRWGSGSVVEDLGLGARWADLGWGPLIWISAVTAQILLGSVILIFDIPTANNTDGIEGISSRPAEMLVLFLGAVVVAPVVEEIVFRRMLQRALISVLAVPWAIVIQAVVFGVLHLNVMVGIGNLGLVIVLSGVGAVFGVGAHLLGRIAPAIIAHAIFNTVVLVLVVSGVLDSIA